MEFARCRDDSSFGPVVQGCRSDFDFTLKFEQIFLAIVPPVVFVASALPRFVYLWQRPIIVAGAALRAAKLTSIAALAGIQLGLLILSAVHKGPLTALFSASSALGLVSALCMLALSFLEHARSLRPSMLMSGYLLLVILFDTAQARTLWLSSAGLGAETQFCRLFTAALACKTFLLVLESVPKTSFLRPEGDSKSHGPEEMSGLLGLVGYTWLRSLFWLGFNKVMQLDDLYRLDSAMDTTALYSKFSRYILKDGSGSMRGDSFDFGHKKHGLAMALFKTLAVPFLLPVGPRIALIGFSFCQPFLINSALTYLAKPSDEAPRNDGYGLIGATVIAYLGMAFSSGLYHYFCERALFMMRGILASSVYQKTTTARLDAADDKAAITLMSTDIENVRRGLLVTHEFWANTIEVALATWLLAWQLGGASAVPVVVSALCVVLTGFVGRLTGKRQKIWMGKIQKRVGMTSTVITHMKFLKISGLATPIEAAIKQMRLDDLVTGGRFRQLVGTTAMLGNVPSVMAPVFTFALTSRDLDVTTVFTSVSFIALVTGPLVSLIQSLPGLIAAFTCLGRIQDFLEKEARVDYREPLTSLEKAGGAAGPDGLPCALPSSAGIRISAGEYGWNADRSTLRNLDLCIQRSKLTMVVGQVASGKSTLCKALLGEMPFHQGRLQVDLRTADGRIRHIGYCDQVPYLSNASLRDNIIGMSAVSDGQYDETRYNEVVEAAMLLPDIALLPQGHRTNVGSNGITLSGGQKQRVSIARALYVDTDLYIFDDILSGLDADTEEEVFRRVFGPNGLLHRRNATMVLCTHSVRHLPLADHIVALAEDGTIVEQGTFESLLANGKYVHSLGVKNISSSSSSSTSRSSTEIRRRGSSRKPQGGRQGGGSPSPDSPQLRSTASANQTGSKVKDVVGEKSRMVGDGSVYRFYFSMVRVVSLVAFGAVSVVAGFFYAWGNIWLKFWVEDTTSAHPRHNNAFYIGLYGLFQILGLVALLGVILIVMIEIIFGTGSQLHNMALRTILRAPLLFFSTTDTGVIINYFSQDLALIDNDLPISVINVAANICIMTATAGVIASSSPYMLIVYPFLGALLYGIQVFYLRTSRQLRLLDLEAKSPLYTHYLDTIQGVATFRAFGWEAAGITLNNRLVDRSQRPAYLLAMVQRCLNFVLGLVVAVLAIAVMALATQLRSNTGLTGASLIGLMSFGSMMQQLIVSFTMLETSIGAVSRLRSLSETVQAEDKPGEDDKPELAWPAQGEIKLNRVSATYDDLDAPDGSSEKPEPPQLVLDQLTLHIRPGEKVAICGRTGSGKSSMLLVLLRLLDPYVTDSDSLGESDIVLDGRPLSKIDRRTLRERIIAVPQDAVFLPDGTPFQKNLDTFGAADAAMCRAALETVGLWPFVEAQGGLEGGLVAAALSQGQKQLFSLARAILRGRVRTAALSAAGSAALATAAGPAAPEASAAVAPSAGGILLLDEVSSSMDQDTDRAMQRVIRDEFAAYTVVMVSHRLDMVMSTCDTVVVLDQGRLAEMGAPQTLAATPGSRFRELWLTVTKETGENGGEAGATAGGETGGEAIL